MVTKLNIIQNGKSASFDIEENSDGSFILASDYEAMKADRDAQQKRADALAVENGQLKEMNSSLCAELQEYESDNDDFGPVPLSVVNCFALLTPATDAVLAAIEARGVEKFIVWSTASSGFDYDLTIEDAQKFAAELREAK